MAAGMLAGALTGFAIWITTDTIALFLAFVGTGYVLGLVFSGAAGRRRERQVKPGGCTAGGVA
jgi:hypothetical protein